jgi:hypothetical protein
MFVKLTTGVNFTNILTAAFLNESVQRIFYFWDFLVKEIFETAACKMLVNLTSGHLHLPHRPQLGLDLPPLRGWLLSKLAGLRSRLVSHLPPAWRSGP